MTTEEKNIIFETATAAAVEALRLLGITSGEVTASRAAAVYGEEFRLLVKAGKIRPVRVGRGVRGTKYYAVADILAARAAEREKAVIIDR